MMVLDYKGGKGGQKPKKKWLRNMWTLPLKYAPVSNQIICSGIYIQTSYHRCFWYYPFSQLFAYAVAQFPKLQDSWNILLECEPQTFLQHKRIVEVTWRSHHLLCQGWTRKVEIGAITTCINYTGYLKWIQMTTLVTKENHINIFVCLPIWPTYSSL